MNDKVLKTLEYTKIIAMLSEEADSEPGRALCAALVPFSSADVIRRAQQDTFCAVGHVLRKGAPSFGGNKDIGWAIKSLEKGQTISTAELQKVAALLESVQRIKQYARPQGVRSQLEDVPASKHTPDSAEGAASTDTTDSLTPRFDTLCPLATVAAEINRCILSDTQIADDASPGLRSVRRHMAQANAKIHSQLASMISGQAKAYLQDAVITMRDGRYCIPIRSEHKNQVPGMIHDRSASGSTFFIEPAAVVNLNNKLRELELQEEEEIAIILATLSALAGQHTDELSINQGVLSELDFIFAKAKLALLQNASMPLFHEGRHLTIRKGRHPLLDAAKVVPIDIHLGRDFDLLVVTGPNTGGKTVSLKTVGLFCLMGQAGLHIPAGDRSELPVFKAVYADIGDEQSIEQNLSTFSSHMSTIVRILEHADTDSLCLFDELGAGTDPVEGAALAISILGHLHEQNIRTMATTHYSELKLFALATAGVENASCEFDIETLRPTFRLLIGIPGKSNAFAISQKLGLPERIIAKARKQIESDDIRFEDVLSELEKNRAAMEKEQLDLQSHMAEIDDLRSRLKDKNAKIDRERERVLDEADTEARQILIEAKEFADLAIRELQKAGGGTDMAKLEQLRSGLRERLHEKEKKLQRPLGATAAGERPKPGELKVGDSVRVLSMGLVGVVSSAPDHKGKLYVQCGSFRSHVGLDDVVLEPSGGGLRPREARDGEPAMTKREGAGGLARGGVDLSKAGSISYEIDLRGKLVDEALAALEKYLDDAYLAHLSSARIVHGKGTGALRAAVQKRLKQLKYVKSFRLGEYGEGDAGVTVVEFR